MSPLTFGCLDGHTSNMTKGKEQPDKVKCTMKLPSDLWRAGRHRAIDEDRDFQDLVADALDAYLKRPLKGAPTK